MPIKRITPGSSKTQDRQASPNTSLSFERNNKSNLSIATIQDAQGYQHYEMEKKIKELHEENARLKRDVRVYRAKAETARPGLKKLDIYKTVKNFKTGSYLRLNANSRNSTSRVNSTLIIKTNRSLLN